MEKKKILFVFTAAVLSLMVGCKTTKDTSSAVVSTPVTSEATTVTTSQATSVPVTSTTSEATSEAQSETTSAAASSEAVSSAEASTSAAVSSEEASSSESSSVREQKTFGTKEAPLTVSEAIELMKGNDWATYDIMYVTGTVKGTPSYNSKYKSYSIYLEAGDYTFQLYSAVLADGVEAPVEGATIKVTGLTQVYVKDTSTTYEVAYDSTNKISPSIYSVENPHVHSYTYTLTKEPTLTETGTATGVCAADEATTEVTVPVLTDTSVWTKTEVTPATFTDDGEDKYTSVYGEVSVTTVLSAEDITVTEKPTETTKGSVTFTDNNGVDHVYELPEITEENGYTEVSEDPTAETAGYKGYTIDIEGYEVLVKTSNLYLITPDSELPFLTFNTRSSTYTFEDDGTGTLVSNNQGKGSSTAYLDMYINVEGTLTFDYVVSSESGYDKATIYATGEEARTAVVNAASGESGGSVTVALKDCASATSSSDFNKIEFQYSKDSSSNSGDDCLTINNIILETPFEEGEATITYNTNGGSEIAPVTVTKAAPFTLPENPTKEGQALVGWYTDEACTKEFNPEVGVFEDTTVYAKWTDAIYITVDLNDGSEPQVYAVISGERFALPANPTKDDYYFAGWTYNGETVSVAIFPSETSTVYATWREPTVLTFNTDGGSEVASISQDINTDFAKPEDPTKEGFRFDGWYTDEACTVPVTWSSNKVTLSASTTYYAKWVAQYEVTYKYLDGTLIKTETVDAEPFEPSLSSSDVNNMSIMGYYDDAEKTTGFTTSILTRNTTIYVETGELKDILAGEGVLSAAVNADAANKISSSSKIYEFTVDTSSGTYTSLKSTNEGVGSSESVISMTLAKDQIVTLDYAAGGETNYDYLTIIKIGADGSTKTTIGDKLGKSDDLVNGSYYIKVLEGETIVISYRKDGSGNKTYDYAEVTLEFEDVEDATVYYVYNDGTTEDSSTTIEMLSTYETLLVEPTNVRGDNYSFGGWYTDEEFTTLATSDMVVNTQEINLYAKWNAKVTATFIVDGESVGTVSEYANNAITFADPTKDNYIFRGWYTSSDEGTTLDTKVDLAEGITENTNLYAKFEEYPEGATMVRAKEFELSNGKVEISGESTEEFQTYYFKFTLTEAQTVIFSDGAATKTGGNISYASYSKFKVVDGDGNEKLASSTWTSYSKTSVKLDAGTYYVVFNMGGFSTSTGWGTFSINAAVYEQDEVSEAETYNFDTTIMFNAGSFADSNETKIYTFTPTESGTYKLFSNAEASSVYVKVYSNEALSTQVTALTNSNGTYSTERNTDLTVVAGTTYYIVCNTNWSASDLAAKKWSFGITNHASGYTAATADGLSVGPTAVAQFDDGHSHYFKIVTTSDDVYTLTVSGGESATKYVVIYNADDLSTEVAKVQLSDNTTANKNNIKLAAGTYILRAYYASDYYAGNFNLSLTVTAAGAVVEKPVAITIPASGSTVDNISATTTETFYSFTASADSVYQFVSSDDSATIKLYSATGTSIGSKTGSYAFEVKEGTTYILGIKASSSDSMTLTYNELEELPRDGLSFATAYLVNENTDTTPAYTTTTSTSALYFEFTATVTGTYNIYSLNTSNIDTRGTLYAKTNTSSSLDSNDDGGSTKMEALGGYKYDFFITYDLVAGETYYLYATGLKAGITINIVAPEVTTPDEGDEETAASIAGSYRGTWGALSQTNCTIELEESGNGTLYNSEAEAQITFMYTYTNGELSISNISYVNDLYEELSLTYDAENNTINGTVVEDSEYTYAITVTKSSLQ